MTENIEESVVAALLAHYIPASQICRYLKITKEHFEDNYSYMDNFEPSVNQNEAVENSLFQLAMNGNHQAVSFWLRNKALWDDGKTDREARSMEDYHKNSIEQVTIKVITEVPEEDE